MLILSITTLPELFFNISVKRFHQTIKKVASKLKLVIFSEMVSLSFPPSVITRKVVGFVTNQRDGAD